MNLLKYVKNLFRKTNKVEVEILEGIDLDDFKDPVTAGTLIHTRLNEISEKREKARSDYETAIDELAMVQKINSMPDKQLKDLENLATSYSERMLEMENFRKKIDSETEQSKYLEKYKQDIPRAIESIKEYEDNQRIIKNDLFQLEGERAEIKYRTQRATKALEIIRFSLIFASFIAIITALVLTILFFVYDIDVLVPSTVMLIILMLLVLWLYIFRRYMVFEIKKNQLLQKREIELTNKVKVKYVNIQQFLDFEYKKYQIDSSEILELRWDNYLRYTKNEESFKRVSKNVAAIIHDVDRLLMKINIDSGNYVTDHMDYFSSGKGRSLLLNALENEKKNRKATFDKCEREINTLNRLMEERL